MNSNKVSDTAIVLNPDYGEPLGRYGSRPLAPIPSWYQKLEQKNGFFTKLESSLLKEGVRNPIYCRSIDEGTFCQYGSTRLWLAQKHHLTIPCIIADYVGRWEELEELSTKEDILLKFKDTPEIVEINNEEMRIEKCSHYHLTN